MRLPLLLSLLLVTSLTNAAPIENKWRLQFSGNAESSGELVLAFTPKDGAATEVRVEVDDGEDVLVKRRWGRPRFNVSLVSNSVEGVRLNLDQE